MSEEACREYAEALRRRAETVASGFREDFLRLAQIWDREAANLAARAQGYVAT